MSRRPNNLNTETEIEVEARPEARLRPESEVRIEARIWHTDDPRRAEAWPKINIKILRLDHGP